MKIASMTFASPGSKRSARDNLFAQSIVRIMNDILLKEIKKSIELKAITIISPFSDDGKSEISEQLSHAFAVQGNKTLLLNLQSMQDPGVYIIDPLKSGKLLEECIIKMHTKNLDYLSLDEIGKSCGFAFDKTSLGNLLNQLKNKYKRIIIDTVSLEEDLSGYMAAGAADGVYFICNESNMRKRQPEQYYRVLKEIGANVLGIVYNNVEPKVVKKIIMKNSDKHG